MKTNSKFLNPQNVHLFGQRSLIMTLTVLMLLFISSCTEESVNAELNATDDFSNIEKKISNDVMSTFYDMECGIETVLYAGQTIDAGTLTVTNDANNLYVTYNLKNDWYLKEVHLYVGDCGEIPVNKKGNPVLGHFPYVMSFTYPYPTSYSETIPLDELGECFCISAHATIGRMNSEGEEESQTAFGGGNHEFDGNRWGYFFDYCVKECDNEEESSCETAFAGPSDDCFLDHGFNRWGWRFTFSKTELMSPISYSLLAGAAHCDETKGTDVGKVIFSYNSISDELTVDISTYSGFTLDESHVWINDSSINWPINSSGSDTVAPGQYGNQHDLDKASSDSYVFDVSSFGEHINLIVHAVVCGDYED